MHDRVRLSSTNCAAINQGVDRVPPGKGDFCAFGQRGRVQRVLRGQEFDGLRTALPHRG